MASKRQIDVGGVKIGGGAPVAVQSMTKTETADYDATLRQIRAVADAGGDIIRCAVPREKDVDALKRAGGRVADPDHRGHPLQLHAGAEGDRRGRALHPHQPGQHRRPREDRHRHREGQGRRRADPHRRQLRVAAQAPARARARELRRGARPGRGRVRRPDAPPGLLRLQGVDQVDSRSPTRSRRTASCPSASTTRSTWASPRRAPSGPDRSSPRSAWARCWPTASATRSASRSPPSTRRRRSRSPGRSSSRSSCASAAPS